VQNGAWVFNKSHRLCPLIRGFIRQPAGIASWNKTDVDTASENVDFVPAPSESAALVSITRREMRRQLFMIDTLSGLMLRNDEFNSCRI
jgi:hypothetical protein